MAQRGITDEALVARALTDREAFGELVERYRGATWRRCWSIVGDRQHAEDLAQDAFVSAFVRLRQLREPARFAAWLARIADNTCRQFLRRQRSDIALPGGGTAEAAPGESPTLQAAALAGLPEETRRCLDMAYRQEMSYAEIGEALGLSEAAVRNRLHRAKARLREELGEMADSVSPFTERVMRKLKQLDGGPEQERAQAARSLRRGLSDEQRQLVIGILRHHAARGSAAPPMPASCPDVGQDWSYIGHLTHALRLARRFPSPETRQLLERILLESYYEEARIQAASALVAQRDPAAIPALRQAEADPSSPQDVRAAARSAIRQLEKATGADSFRAEATRMQTDLEAAVADRAARRALVRRLTETLADPSPAVRSQAVQALAKLGDKRASGPIARLLQDPVPGVRQAAAGALGDLGSKQAVLPLVRTLASADRGLQGAIVAALGRIGDSRGIAAVLETAEAGDDTAFVHAMYALEQMADAANLALIEQRIRVWRDGPSVMRRDWAERVWADALARCGGPEHARLMAAALAATPQHERLPARLAEVAGEAAVEPLVGSAAQGNHHAAAALLRLGQPGAEAVKRMLEAPELPARLAVFRGVTFGGPEAVSAAAADPELVGRLKGLADTERERPAKLYAGTTLRRLRKAGV